MYEKTQMKIPILGALTISAILGTIFFGLTLILPDAEVLHNFKNAVAGVMWASMVASLVYLFIGIAILFGWHPGIRD